jgi:hypothetical protein
MSIRSWLRSVFTRPATRSLRQAPRRARLSLEALEDRTVPSTFIVTNTNDSGAGSLREAIDLANASVGVADTIVFNNKPSHGTNFFDNTPDTITLTSGQLTLTDSATTTITGPGANLLAISGGGLSRVFNVGVGASAALSGLTITGGNADSGGGLFNSGTATLTDCTVSANSATGGGGGIFNSMGDPYDPLATLTLINCTVSANTGVVGGGVYNGGTATLTNCTISENSSASVSVRGGGAGGGGLNPPPTDTETGTGGGVFSSGTATLTNCTISKNSASGLFVWHGNILGFFGAGGGLSGEGFTLANTIVAGNSADLAAPDVSGSVTSGCHNLIGITDGSSGWVGSDLTDAAASPLNLGPLADNGGPTQTMALLPGSVAIDAGNPALAPATDQRGRARSGNTDIGAYEWIATVMLEASVSSQGTINLGSNGSIVLHLVVAAGQLSGTDTVASLFNGATFTIAIQNADGSETYGTLQSIAQVDGNGNINVTLQMNDTLRAELYQAGRAVNFNVTAISNDGNYAIDEDTLSKLLNNGAFMYVQ